MILNRQIGVGNKNIRINTNNTQNITKKGVCYE